MEPENRPDAPRNLPAVPSEPVYRPPGPDPWGSPDPWETSRQRRLGGAGPSPAAPWLRRLRPRSVRLAAGLGIIGAAVLLFPFAAAQSTGQNYAWWLPIGLGVGSLALITLFRLDRVLFGWAPHVAGLVLVGTLVWQTSANPWAWGLAVGVGVVVAGLFLLPRWRVLAAGAVLLVVFGVGYQFRSADIADQQARVDAQAGEQLRTILGVERPQLALVALDSGVTDNNPRRVCRLVQDAALAQLLQSTAASSCEQAVGNLHTRVARAPGRVTEPDRSADPTVAPGQSTVVDGCSTAWGAATGPALGRVVLVRTDAPSPIYQVAFFQPC